MPKNAQTTTVLILHASKVMLKILQARLQQYMNQQVTSWVLKRQRTRNLIANIYWIMEKAREFQKNIYFFINFIDYEASLTMLKPLIVWITKNCEKLFKRQEYQTT